jgi:hypothetical protein
MEISAIILFFHYAVFRFDPFPSFDESKFDYVFNCKGAVTGRITNPESDSRNPVKERNRKIGLTWPLDGKVKVTDEFGRRYHPILKNWRMHYGIDMVPANDSYIRTVSSGKVIFSGVKEGYGRTVIIEHNDSLKTLYSHNSINYVHRGEYVQKGEVVGRIGQSGLTTGKHLHFEVILNDKRVNPLNLLEDFFSSSEKILFEVDSFKRKYALSLNYYMKGDYSKAIDGFTELLNYDYGNELSDNSIYWIGESYFAMGKYSSAVKAFEQVLYFPYSEKIEPAKYMIAKSYYKQGNYRAARQILLDFKRDFPESSHLSYVENLLKKLE